MTGKKETAQRRKSKSKANDFRFVMCSGTAKVAKEAREKAIQAGNNPTLAAHAAVIRRLGRRVIADLIQIGGRLTEAKKLVEHGGWEAWLKAEFGWSSDTALNFMRVYALSDDYKSRKSRNFRDLKIAPSALYLLGQPSTPEAVKTEIIGRAEAGEAIGVGEVREAISAEDPIDDDETETTADDENPAAETETTQTPADRNNERWWQAAVKRANEAVKLANEVIRQAGIVNSNIEAEQVRSLRAVVDPALLPELREAGEALIRGGQAQIQGGQALNRLADFLENITRPELAQAAE